MKRFKSAWESGMLGLPDMTERTFGERAFDALSERLGRAPTASEIIEFVNENTQDAVEVEVNE